MAVPVHEEWRKVEGYDFDDLIYEKKYLKTGGVARMTINRPAKLNSFTGATIRHMWECIFDINSDPSIGVAIMTGAGDKAFCTGGDVEAEAEGEFEDTVFLNCNKMIVACRKPIIAVVKGWSVGGGNHMAYCCDFTIAADNARFAQNGPRVGSPACGWPIQYAVRVVGAKKAREMWMLCRRYSAQEAQEMGLVNSVVPLDKIDEEVDKWCEEILSLSPGCLEILKASFDMDIDYMSGSYGQMSRVMYPDWFDSKECKEGPKAFMEKRKPDFWKIRKAEIETKKKL